MYKYEPEIDHGVFCVKFHRSTDRKERGDVSLLRLAADWLDAQPDESLLTIVAINVSNYAVEGYEYIELVVRRA